MHLIMRHLGVMGLGIVVAGYLSGAPVVAAEKPFDDGSTITINAPKDGDTVKGAFPLKYTLTKGSKAAHAHVFVDGVYQKGFTGILRHLDKGTHQITVTAATKDHELLAASDTITVKTGTVADEDPEHE